MTHTLIAGGTASDSRPCLTELRNLMGISQGLITLVYPQYCLSHHARPCGCFRPAILLLLWRPSRSVGVGGVVVLLLPPPPKRTTTPPWLLSSPHAQREQQHPAPPRKACPPPPPKTTTTPSPPIVVPSPPPRRTTTTRPVVVPFQENNNNPPPSQQPPPQRTTTPPPPRYRLHLLLCSFCNWMAWGQAENPTLQLLMKLVQVLILWLTQDSAKPPVQLYLLVVAGPKARSVHPPRGVL